MFKNIPREQRKQWVKAMIGRLAEAYGVQPAALPRRLGRPKNVIGNWIYYGRVPFEQLHRCHMHTGCSIDWLLYGRAGQPPLCQAQIEQLLAFFTKVFNDGLDYGMISQKYPGALEQLVQKLEKDLAEWVGPTAVTGQEDQ